MKQVNRHPIKATFHKKPVAFAAIVIVLIALSILLFLKSDRKFKPETFPIMAGTAVETAVARIESSTPGKTVMVIGGIHGDEISGWKALERLKKTDSVKSGTLLILSPANAPGCRDRVRNVEQYRDLNRSFPGEKNRDLTDRLAAEIFKIIGDCQPDIIIDLHEAYREKGNRDFLGNSLIFSDLSGIEDIVSTIVLETQEGTLCKTPFSYYGPAPRGSLNLEVTSRLDIPVITIEASQEDNLEDRIANHLDLVHWILRYWSIE